MTRLGMVSGLSNEAQTNTVSSVVSIQWIIDY